MADHPAAADHSAAADDPAELGVFGKSDPGLQYVLFTGYRGDTSVTRTRIPGMRVQ